MTNPETMDTFEADKTPVLLLGDAARGTIEAKADQMDQLDNCMEDLRRGRFHSPATIINLAACVDGRLPKLPGDALVANAAGGTLTYFVANHLISEDASDNPTVEDFTKLADFLRDQHVTIGGHTDAHAGEHKTGCGANDRLEEIYAYIAEHSDTLQEWAGKLGVEVPEDTHQRITTRAKGSTNFPLSTDIKSVLEERTTPEFMPELEGEHKEVVVVVNTRTNITLDRAALAEVYGPDTQAFNVDVWAFEEAARQISGDDEYEVQQKIAAMVYYNLATAFVLAGSGMRVVALE